MTRRVTDHAQRIAPRALDWFTGVGEAKALHLGRQVSYFENPRGEILGVAGSEATMAPLFVGLPPGSNLPLRLRRLEPTRLAEERFEVSPQGLRGRSFEVLIGEAAAWRPRPPWSALPAPPVVLRSLEELNVETAAGDLEVLAQGTLASLARDWPASVSLNAAHALVGRGEGLTPAGDDCLTGFFFALWATGRATREAEHSAAKNLATGLSNRTTRLSGAMLQSAADGEAPEVWHHWIEALIRGEEYRANIGRSLLDWGASSGRYILQSFHLVYRCLVEARGPSRAVPSSNRFRWSSPHENRR